MMSVTARRARAAFCLIALIAFGVAHAALPRSANVPGGVALVDLGSLAAHPRTPQVWLGEQPVLVGKENGRWVAVVGLALDLAAGKHELRLTTGDETRHLAFEVKAKHYPEQRITLKDSSKVQLSAVDAQRVERELAELRRLKNQWTESPDTPLSFQLPVDGRHVGRFGLRRTFNGEPRAPHAGFDIAVARGTAVKAGAPGLVLAVDDYFFNGKTVLLDHGKGLLSMVCHLDRIDVQAGETVGQGQRLGLSGMTGRATGPHVHWSIVLNGAMVDPELFVPTQRKAR